MIVANDCIVILPPLYLPSSICFAEGTGADNEKLLSLAKKRLVDMVTALRTSLKLDEA
jgi:hypothetical protein